MIREFRAPVAALLLLTAAPVAGQTSGTPAPVVMPTATSPAVQLSPEHLAAARRFAELVVPRGVMQRVLGGSSGLSNGTMETVLGMRVGDMGSSASADETIDPDMTIGELMTARDPHFRERTRISLEVTNRITGELFVEIEPDVREAMAEVYGGRFSLTELEELIRFFETPTGRKFAEAAPTVMQDPAFLQAMQGLMPRLMAVGPRIAQEVAAATAHLPPPPDDDEESAEQPPAGD